MDTRGEPGGWLEAGTGRKGIPVEAREGGWLWLHLDFRAVGSGTKRGDLRCSPQPHLWGSTHSSLLSLLQGKTLQPRAASWGVCACVCGLGSANPPSRLTKQGVLGSSHSAYGPCQDKGLMLDPSQPDLGVYTASHPFQR